MESPSPHPGFLAAAVPEAPQIPRTLVAATLLAYCAYWYWGSRRKKQVWCFLDKRAWFRKWIYTSYCLLGANFQNEAYVEATTP